MHQDRSIPDGERQAAGGVAAPARSALVGQAVRIGAVLTLITTSILSVVSSAGVWPDPAPAVARERSALAEAVAIAASQAITRGDSGAITSLADGLPGDGSGVLSACVRRSDGVVLLETPRHRECWRGAPDGGSDTAHARVPVFAGDVPWGVIELSFEDRCHARMLGMTVPVVVPAIGMSALLAFIAYSVGAYISLVRVQASGTVRSRVQTVFDALSEAVVLLDHNGTIVLANGAFWAMVKRPRGSLIGHSPSLLSWDERCVGSRSHPWQETLLDGCARQHRRMTLIDEGSVTRYFSVSTASVTAPGGGQAGVLVTLEDVTLLEEQSTENTALLAQLARTGEELRTKNQELEVLAAVDPLTGCLNRRALFDKIRGLWQPADGRAGPFGCIMVDVDHFKAVNDGYGHATGDRVLADLGRRLQEVMGLGDIVGRYGGEEFCVLTPGTDAQGTLDLAERIRAAVREFPCGGLDVTVSLGCSVRRQRDGGPDEVLCRADSSLYAAKRAGRNCTRMDEQDPRSLAA